MVLDEFADTPDDLSTPEVDQPKGDDANLPSLADQQLVSRIIATIRADKRFHEKAFKQMRRDMHVAKYGSLPGAPADQYKANLCGRHVKQKTAALYAKNPKATAKRRDTLDYRVWDEDPKTLQIAYTTVMQAQEVMAQQAAIAEQGALIDPKTGQAAPAPMPMLAGLQEAQELLEDFQQGTQRRQLIQRTGRTLEILFGQALREQKPVDFKRGMKKLVRRACTTAVGYVELGFQRETGPRPGLQEQLSDARSRLDHLKRLAEEAAEGEIDPDDAEMAELQHSIAALEAEPEIVLREGLIVDFPMSTKVIPDKLCKSLDGFVGARHLTIEYLFTPDEIKEVFGVDIATNAADDSGKGGDLYGCEGTDVSSPQMELDLDDFEGERTGAPRFGDALKKVWKHYDKPSGMVYFVAEGHKGFLRPPAAPDVFVEDFWPVYALTFNDVEHEEELFPPSDVDLMLPMQIEYNRSRQGKREHRKAARPRFAASRGAFGETDMAALMQCNPFEVTLLDTDPQTKVGDLIAPFPMPGVDPNLYDVGEIFTDIQFVVGSSEAQFGGVSKATATESAIAANSSSSSDGSAVDDLDGFLSNVARAAGQILLREMSEETVTRIVGPGAVWPHLTLTEIAEELYLEIEAGSTGKPNQAVQVNNAKIIAPLLMQTGAVSPLWLARYLARTLDDNIDITDAIIAGIPSIVAMNAQAPGGAPGAAAPGAPPENQPAAQGAEGAHNAPAPPAGDGGSDPAFGSNQV